MGLNFHIYNVINVDVAKGGGAVHHFSSDIGVTYVSPPERQQTSYSLLKMIHLKRRNMGLDSTFTLLNSLNHCLYNYRHLYSHAMVSRVKPTPLSSFNSLKKRVIRINTSKNLF